VSQYCAVENPSIIGTQLRRMGPGRPMPAAHIDVTQGDVVESNVTVNFVNIALIPKRS
jgi:hypothetical protein